MNTFETPADYILSFRHLLTSAVTEFLSERQMTCTKTSEALSELVISLSSYREEGSPLFPQVFICEDITAMLQALRGRDPMSVSDGERSRGTMRRALKQCAPLSRGGWAVYFQLDDPERFSYGLFRTDNFILSSTPIELLRAIKDPSIKLFGISRVAENIIELCASAGYRRFIHLSGARTDVPHPTHVLEDIVQAVTADVDEPFKQPAQSFYRHAFFDAMQAPHGSLAMVIPKDAPKSSLLDDGVMLQPSIDVVARIEAYKSDPREEKATSLQAVVTLLHGMLSADGITVLRSDGCLVGYNVFVEQPALREGEVPIGGARRRSFNVLCSHLGQELTAAFYRSQDGVALCERSKLVPAQPLDEDFSASMFTALHEGTSVKSNPLATMSPPYASAETRPAAEAPAGCPALAPQNNTFSSTPVVQTIPESLPQALQALTSAEQHTAQNKSPQEPFGTVPSVPSFSSPISATPVPWTESPKPAAVPQIASSVPQPSLSRPTHVIEALSFTQPHAEHSPTSQVPAGAEVSPASAPVSAAPNLAVTQLEFSTMAQQQAMPFNTAQMPKSIHPEERHGMCPSSDSAGELQPSNQSSLPPTGQRAVIEALCRNELHPISQMAPSIQSAPPAQEESISNIIQQISKEPSSDNKN